MTPSGQAWTCNASHKWDSFIKFCQEKKEAGANITFKIVNSKHRSLEQNDMKEFQVTEIAKHCHGGDERAARRQIKLEVGVPILRRDNPEFRALYDKVIKHHDYETKLEMMDHLPVTSSMKVSQMTECIENTFRHFATVVPWPEKKQ